MANERLCAYYEAQRPSEACMVRLCNLEQRPRPKPLILRLALPMAAACLLILVLVTQIRPTPEGVTAPLATSTPTARETLTPEPTPSVTVTSPQSPQAVDGSAPQIPTETTAPITEGPVIPPENEGGGSDMSMPEPSPSNWWWLGGAGGAEPNSEGSASLYPAEWLVTDITGTYEDGYLTFTDLNTGESISIDLRDEPVEPGDNVAGIHIFGRDLIIELLLDADAEHSEIIILEIPTTGG